MKLKKTTRRSKHLRNWWKISAATQLHMESDDWLKPRRYSADRYGQFLSLEPSLCSSFRRMVCLPYTWVVLYPPWWKSNIKRWVNKVCKVAHNLFNCYYQINWQRTHWKKSERVHMTSVTHIKHLYVIIRLHWETLMFKITWRRQQCQVYFSDTYFYKASSEA